MVLLLLATTPNNCYKGKASITLGFLIFSVSSYAADLKEYDIGRQGSLSASAVEDQLPQALYQLATISLHTNTLRIIINLVSL